MADPGTFFGITAALRGLQVQQEAMDVTSHNIANASTPGYSRQIADMQTTDPYAPPDMALLGAGQLGTGVQITSITRAHDDFVQQQIAYQNQQQSAQQSLSDNLSAISQVYNDPSNQGFSTLLSSYLTSWQQLANNPSDNPTRAAVIAQGQSLTAGFNTAANALIAMQQSQDTQVGQYVTQINTITGQIAGLNQQITAVVATGQQPNDLNDQRDTLLNQLSQIADINYVRTPNGSLNVALAGEGALVQGASSFQLATLPDQQASVHVAAQPGFNDVVFQGQTTPLQLSGGQLGGALTARDTTLKGQLSALNTLASNVMSAVNGYQTTGYDANGNLGQAFFTGTTAANMTVNPALQNNPALLAAAATPNNPGDGANALLMSQLQENPAPGQTGTLQAQYQSIISALGVQGQRAQTAVQTGALVLQNLNAQQSSVSGVSLNEEASNLIQFQNAYQAASRVISIMNQTISDMITQLGG